MKKVLATVLAVIMLFATFAVGASAEIMVAQISGM